MNYTASQFINILSIKVFLTFKCVHWITPVYLCRFLILKPSRGLRLILKFCILWVPRSKWFTCGYITFSYHAPSLWNSLSFNRSLCQSESQFSSFKPCHVCWDKSIYITKITLSIISQIYHIPVDFYPLCFICTVFPVICIQILYLVLISEIVYWSSPKFSRVGTIYMYQHHDYHMFSYVISTCVSMSDCHHYTGL